MARIKTRPISSLEKKQFLVTCFLFHARKITQSPLWHTDTSQLLWQPIQTYSPYPHLAAPQSPVLVGGGESPASLPVEWWPELGNIMVERTDFSWSWAHFLLIVGYITGMRLVWEFSMKLLCKRFVGHLSQPLRIRIPVNQIFQTIPAGSITQSTFHFIFFFFVHQYRKGKGRNSFQK